MKTNERDSTKFNLLTELPEIIYVMAKLPNPSAYLLIIALFSCFNFCLHPQHSFFFALPIIHSSSHYTHALSTTWCQLAIIFLPGKHQKKKICKEWIELRERERERKREREREKERENKVTDIEWRFVFLRRKECIVYPMKIVLYKIQKIFIYYI